MKRLVVIVVHLLVRLIRLPALLLAAAPPPLPSFLVTLSRLDSAAAAKSMPAAAKTSRDRERSTPASTPAIYIYTAVEKRII